MSWLFIISRKAPTLNDHVQNSGPSRWKYGKERDMWMLEFRAARLNFKIPPATGVRAVTVTRLFTGRERPRDYINLVGGMKAIVDALVLEKLLIDDSPEWLQDEYRQERTAKTCGVQFEITEISTPVDNRTDNRAGAGHV